MEISPSRLSETNQHHSYSLDEMIRCAHQKVRSKTLNGCGGLPFVLRVLGSVHPKDFEEIPAVHEMKRTISLFIHAKRLTVPHINAIGSRSVGRKSKHQNSNYNQCKKSARKMLKEKLPKRITRNDLTCTKPESSEDVLISEKDYEALKNECKAILTKLHDSQLITTAKGASDESKIQRGPPPDNCQVLCFDCGVDQFIEGYDDFDCLFLSNGCLADGNHEEEKYRTLDLALQYIRKVVESTKNDGSASLLSAYPNWEIYQAFQVIVEQEAFDSLIDMESEDWSSFVKLMLLKRMYSDDDDNDDGTLKSFKQISACENSCEGSHNTDHLVLLESLVHGFIRVAHPLQLYELQLQLLSGCYSIGTGETNDTKLNSKCLVTMTKLFVCVTNGLADPSVSSFLGGHEIENALYQGLNITTNAQLIDYFTASDAKGSWLNNWICKTTLSSYYISLIPLSQPDTMNSILEQVNRGSCYAANLLSLILPLIGGKYASLFLTWKDAKMAKRLSTVDLQKDETKRQRATTRESITQSDDCTVEKDASDDSTYLFNEFSCEQAFLFCDKTEEYFLRVTEIALQLSSSGCGESTTSCNERTAAQILVDCLCVMKASGVRLSGIEYVLFKMTVDQLFQVQLLKFERSTWIMVHLTLQLVEVFMADVEEESASSSCPVDFSSEGNRRSDQCSENSLDEWISDSYQVVLSFLEKEYSSLDAVRVPMPTVVEILFSLQSFCVASLCRTSDRLTKTLDTILTFAECSHPAHIFFDLSKNMPFCLCRILVSASLHPFGWHQLCVQFSTVKSTLNLNGNDTGIRNNNKHRKPNQTNPRCESLSGSFGVSTEELLAEILSIENLNALGMMNSSEMEYHTKAPVFERRDFYSSVFRHLENFRCSPCCMQLLQRWSTVSVEFLQPNLSEVASSVLNLYSGLMEGDTAGVKKEGAEFSFQGSLLGVPLEYLENASEPSVVVFSVGYSEHRVHIRVNFWQSLYHMLTVFGFPFKQKGSLYGSGRLVHEQLWNEMTSLYQVYPFLERSFFRLLSIFSWCLWLDPLAGATGTLFFEDTPSHQEENEKEEQHHPLPTTPLPSRWISAWFNGTPGRGPAEVLMQIIFHCFTPNEKEGSDGSLDMLPLIDIIPVAVPLLHRGWEAVFDERKINEALIHTQEKTERFLSGVVRSSPPSARSIRGGGCIGSKTTSLKEDCSSLIKTLSNASIDVLHAYFSLVSSEVARDVGEKTFMDKLRAVTTVEWQKFLFSDVVLSNAPEAGPVPHPVHSIVWDIVELLYRDEKALVECLFAHGVELFWIIHVALTQWCCAPKSPRNVVQQAALRSFQVFVISGYKGWKEWLAKKLAHFFHSSLDLVKTTMIETTKVIVPGADREKCKEVIQEKVRLRNRNDSRFPPCASPPTSYVDTMTPLAGPSLVGSFILLYGFMDPISILK